MYRRHRSDQPLGLIDDLALTNGDGRQLTRAVGPAIGGLKVDRLEGAAEAFSDRGYPLRSLLTIRDLGLEPKE